MGPLGFFTLMSQTMIVPSVYDCETEVVTAGILTADENIGIANVGYILHTGYGVIPSNAYAHQ